jgi:mRNA deadenylase 3'-5' endonuclease subunit Ccr4
MPKDISYERHKQPSQKKPKRQQQHSNELSVRIEITSNHSDSEPFKLLNWNILAPELLDAHQHLYQKCKAEALNWKLRRTKLLATIVEQSPDIVCLQEVSKDFFYALQREMKETRFHAKCVLRDKEKDGCCLLLNYNRFYLHAFKIVEFKNIAVELGSNCAILALVTDRIHDKKCLIATTHLVWNPKQGMKKWKQLNALLETIEDFLTENDSLSVPIILTGDFNFSDTSFLHDYVIRGRNEGWVDRELMSGQLEKLSTKSYMEYDSETCPLYAHPFQFESILASEYPQRMSTIVDGKPLTVDHVFLGHHQKGGKEPLVVTRQLTFPLADSQVNLPDEANPSDHVPIIVSFAFKI